MELVLIPAVEDNIQRNNPESRAVRVILLKLYRKKLAHNVVADVGDVEHQRKHHHLAAEEIPKRRRLQKLVRHREEEHRAKRYQKEDPHTEPTEELEDGGDMWQLFYHALIFLCYWTRSLNCFLSILSFEFI